MKDLTERNEKGRKISDLADSWKITGSGIHTDKNFNK
jgi:hypothetical protein